MEPFPHIDPLDPESLSDPQLQRLIRGDLEDINDKRIGAEDEALTFTYLPSPDNWYGYAIMLGPCPSQATPHRVVLAKVDARDYERIEPNKMLTLRRGLPLQKSAKPFDTFDREELEAIAGVLSEYRESGYQNPINDAPGLVFPFRLDARNAEIKKATANISHQKQPVEIDDSHTGSKSINEKVIEDALNELERRGVEEHDVELCSLSLRLDVDEVHSYVAQLSSSAPGVLDGMDIICLYENKFLDRFQISIDENSQTIIEEEPERAILWNPVIISNILISGRTIDSEAAYSMLGGRIHPEGGRE